MYPSTYNTISDTKFLHGKFLLRSEFTKRGMVGQKGASTRNCIS